MRHIIPLYKELVPRMSAYNASPLLPCPYLRPAIAAACILSYLMEKATFWKNHNTLHEFNKPSDISFTVKEIASRKFPDYDDFTWEDMK